MISKRYLASHIQSICFNADKMCFVSGPRQSGKTTLAKQLLKQRGVGDYFNWDDIKFRRLWAEDPANIIPANNQKTTPLVILDEIHKAKSWKRSLKGVYDTLKEPCDILVTGSARLNVYRRGSDSLLGRYYLFRLHPFSLAEVLKENTQCSCDELIKDLFSQKLKPSKKSQPILDQLCQYGPFPEPFLAASMQTLRLWQRGRVQKLIREDLRDLSRLPDLSQIEMLVSLLPERVGGLLSIQSLARDLETSYTTMKRWLNYLNELYYCFNVRPYSASIARSIRKSSKLYLWDYSEIENEACRFENLIASHLLKYCHFCTDTGLGEFKLHYLRNKEKKEIDFLITRDKKPWLPVEVKLSDTALSSNWKSFLPNLACDLGVQVVKQPGVFICYQVGNKQVIVVSADYFLRFFA